MLAHADLARLAWAARRALDDPSSYFLDKPPSKPAVAATLKARVHEEYGKMWNRRFPGAEHRVAVFNSGVMVIDFERWNRYRLTAAVEEWIGHNPISGSQLPINLAVDSNFAVVDATWNCPIRGGGDAVEPVHTDSDKCTRAPLIRHWVGRAKPWLRNGRLAFFWFSQVHSIRGCLRLALPNHTTPLASATTPYGASGSHL